MHACSRNCNVAKQQHWRTLCKLNFEIAFFCSFCFAEGFSLELDGYESHVPRESRPNESGSRDINMTMVVDKSLAALRKIPTRQSSLFDTKQTIRFNLPAASIVRCNRRAMNFLLILKNTLITKIPSDTLSR